MTNQEMKKVLVKASIFAVISISLMLYRSATKHIMITDAAGTVLDRGSEDDSYKLLVNDQVPKGKENTLIIPLPKSVSSDDILLEDRYVDHELCIHVDSRDEGFYLDNAVFTDLGIIESATCIKENDTGDVRLSFKLDGLYANESSLTDNSTIEVKFFKPSEKYDHIVVIDPVGGGIESGVITDQLVEKNVTLDVATALKATTDREINDNTRYYYTRLGDYQVSPEKRAALIRDSEADLYIQISAEQQDDNVLNGITTYYNDRFFLRGFNNGHFADIIERNVVSKTLTEANGVFPAPEGDDMLMASQIPSARICIGNLSGDLDSGRLADPTYARKVSEGIYQAVLQSFEEME
jgi:N-acetylmuramoyl-L-alanine amidase